MGNSAKLLLTKLYDPPITTRVSSYSPKVGFHTETQIVKTCDIMCEEILGVILTPEVVVKINSLMEAFPNLEWLAYLEGKLEGGSYTVSDLIIPKQKLLATTVEVDFEEELNLPNIIGSIHSHHTMGAFFSSTDEQHIVPNYPVSIVVSTKGWVCQVRQVLPCKNFIIRDTPLSISTPTLIDTEAFLKIAKAKMTLQVFEVAKYDYDSLNSVSKQPPCLCCGRFINRYVDMEYHGGAWYCKSCVAIIGQLTLQEWTKLTKELGSMPLME